MTYNVLVVDDEKEIRDAIEIYLRGEGINTFKAENGYEALEILLEEDINLIILDIMMPKMDGITTCIKIREEKNIPIIMLSAKSEDSDKILGLNIGADDYVTKPFNPLELIARVKSQLRRYLTLGNVVAEGKDEIIIKELKINKCSHEVYVDGAKVHLTPIEYNILLLLSENRGRVFSSEDIYRRVWKDEPVNVDSTVTVHIRRIREKIEINPKEPKYIKVVWGIGYKIEA
ncbi:response regulator transcription factor [Clostridium sp.]|uniref:response regulator transcription factor n=2 Tax=Clostridium sp. TaxID=1506 RepID=UPI002FC62568